MSHAAVDWASQQIVPKAADKATLWALADAVNRSGWDAWLSIAAIAHFASLNRKQVIASLKRLEACGFIADTGQRIGRTAQVKVYRLNPKEYPIGDCSPRAKESPNRNCITDR